VQQPNGSFGRHFTRIRTIAAIYGIEQGALVMEPAI
jgi:hypothetical protein